MRPVKLKKQTARKLHRLLKDASPDKTHLMRKLSQNTHVVRVEIWQWAGNIPQFGIVDMTGSRLEPDEEVEDKTRAFRESMVLGGYPPGTGAVGNDELNTKYGGFGIACEPIPAGQIGKVWYAGYCVVKIQVSNTRHGFADADTSTSPGEVNHLVSRRTGPCKIIWKEPGTGLKWAIVYHGGINAANVWPQFAFVKLTDVTTHPMQGRVQVWHNSTNSLVHQYGTGDDLVEVFRYPTYTNNDLYAVDNIVAAVRVAEAKYVTLHTVPIQFAVDAYEGP